MPTLLVQCAVVETEEPLARPLDPLLELGGAAEREPLEKTVDVELHRVARASLHCLREHRDVAFDGAGKRHLVPVCDHRLAERGAEVLERLAERCASAFLVGLAPEKRRQRFSGVGAPLECEVGEQSEGLGRHRNVGVSGDACVWRSEQRESKIRHACRLGGRATPRYSPFTEGQERSEERRVGKECRSRGTTGYEKAEKKKIRAT